MCSASSARNSCTHMFPAFDACSFCSALDFLSHIYIRLEKHVCFASSYINFDIYCQSPTHIQLKPHTPQYLLDFRSYSTLDPLLFDLCKPRNYFHSTFNSATSLQSLGSTYTCIQLEIPGPRQKASTVHKLKPLSRTPSHLEPQDLTYMSGSLGLDL